MNLLITKEMRVKSVERLYWHDWLWMLIAAIQIVFLLWLLTLPEVGKWYGIAIVVAIAGIIRSDRKTWRTNWHKWRGRLITVVLYEPESVKQAGDYVDAQTIYRAANTFLKQPRPYS